MRRLVTLVLATVSAMAVFLASPVGAAGHVTTIETGFAGGLGLSVTPFDTLYVAEAFGGTLTRVDDGVRSTIAEGFVAGVDAAGDHVVYPITKFDDEGNFLSSTLEVSRPDGTQETLGDIWAFEQTHNPDGFRTYGFIGIDEDCAKTVEEITGFPAVYTGIVESNPYAVARFNEGPNAPRDRKGYVVADAAGNTILGVRNGNVRLIASLPPQPMHVTKEIAENSGLPECVVGLTYNFEAVPTDVEIWGDKILVSTLPGGPESPELGARGGVYELDLSAKKMRRLATGFVTNVDLAVSDTGRIFAAELFAGQISELVGGSVVPIASVPTPGAIEWANGKLYASVDVFGAGEIVTIGV